MKTFAVGLFACAVLGGCVGSPPEPPPSPGTAHYQLTCDSPIGAVKTWMIYTVTASAEPMHERQAVTYTLNAPVAQVKSPVSTDFRKSVVTFAIPSGLQVTGVSTTPATLDGFDGIDAHRDGADIVFTLTGDFPLDGTPHAVPTVVVTGVITAAPGASVVWMTPTSIDGVAHAGIFGDQSSHCHFESPGPIWTSTVQ